MTLSDGLEFASPSEQKPKQHHGNTLCFLRVVELLGVLSFFFSDGVLTLFLRGETTLDVWEVVTTQQ